MTPDERKASAKDRNRMKPSTKEAQDETGWRNGTVFKGDEKEIWIVMQI